MTNKTYAIVGGGIGGLTLAIAMQRKGYKVNIYENTPTIKPLGAGLILAANAVKALTEIGISEEVLQSGKILKRFRIKDKLGNILSETDSEKLNARFGVVNNFTVHRADLHDVLTRLLEPGTLYLNKNCVGHDSVQSGVDLYFQDGTVVQTDYLIACDGIHSPIRKKLLPNSLPRYAGYTCWRAVIDKVPAGIDMDEASESWGPGLRFGIVPISNNRLYWFACVNAKAQDAEMQAMRIQQLQQHFSNFHAPIGEILSNTPDHKLIHGDILDIKPIKKFAFGKVVLLGDAAHATTPNMGQGACMAIEDAATLANCLDHFSTAEEAFIQYERKRLERTTKVINNSRTIGKVAQLENSMLISLRNMLMKSTPASVTEKQLKFITEISF